MIQLKIKSLITDKDFSHNLYTKDDFLELYGLFPQLKPIVEKSPNLWMAAEAACRYLNNHNMEASIAGEDDGMLDEITDPHDFDDTEVPENPESLEDMRKYLESKKDYIEVHIPENIVLQEEMMRHK